MRKKISRILSIVLTIITLSMIGAVGLAALQMGQNRGVPTLFNHSFFVVSTGSMEPTLPVGVGLIIERVEDFESLRPAEVDPITEEMLYEGDILTFFLNDRIVTHRLVRIEVNPNQPEVYGANRFVTQGDCFGCSEDNPIYEADINWSSRARLSTHWLDLSSRLKPHCYLAYCRDSTCHSYIH